MSGSWIQTGEGAPPAHLGAQPGAGFLFILVALIAVNHTLAETGQAIPFLANASIHAICPFGGVDTLYQLLTTGVFVSKIHSSAVVLLGITLLLSILAPGPLRLGLPVGHPPGMVREIWTQVVQAPLQHQFVPANIDHVLRYLRYLVWPGSSI